MAQSAIKANSFQIDLSAFQFSSKLAKPKDEAADEASQLVLRSSALVARANRPPDVSGTDFRVVSNEERLIRSSIKATDPNGDAIVRYRFRDAVQSASSGYFKLGGTNKAQNKWFTVAAGQLKNLKYVAGKVAGSETIKVQAFDGSLWSNIDAFTAFTRANDNPPIIRPASFDIRVGTGTAIEGIFKWRDEDNNTIKKYRFTDTNGAARGGYLTQNGFKVRAKTLITVNAAALDTIGYQAGNKAHSEVITIQAFDGKFWSNPEGIRVDTLDVPVIAPEPYTYVDEFKKLDIVDLFRKVDAGPAHAEYEIFDNNTTRGSGELWLGNTVLPKGINTITDNQLQNLTFRGGNADERWFDELYIRANNRLYFGDWIKIDVRTEAVNKAALQIPGLQGPLSWLDFTSGNKITYSFMQSLPIYQTAEVTDITFRTLTAQNRNFVRDAFEKLESQLGVDFEEISDSVINGDTGDQGGLIRIGGMSDETKTYYSFSYLPGDTEESGDIYLNLSRRITTTLPDGSTVLVPNPAARPPVLRPDRFVRYIFQRELGQALGMKSPSLGNPQLPAFTNDRRFTVMKDVPPPFPFFPDVWPSSYQLYDLLALQDAYGVGTGIVDGVSKTDRNNNYKWNASRSFSEAIYDPSGNDTIDASNQTFGVTIDLRTGAYSSIGRFAYENVGIAYGTIIENAKGSNSKDTLTGNEYRNRLVGNDGDDTLDGGSENDNLLGGRGGDTYIFRLAGGKDTINEEGKGGIDALEIRLEWNAFDSIKDLTFQKLGKDLVVNLFIDQDPLNGSIRIKDMGTPSSRVETLRLFNNSGKISPDIDLTSAWAGAAGVEQQFKYAGGSSSFGRLVTPV